jgi:hypothetical protein
LVNVFKITVETVEVPSASSKYKTPPIKKVFSVSKGNSFTWQEDFILELKDDPHWLPSPSPTGNQSLINAGSFSLTDDDSLELELVPDGGDLPIPANTRNLMSGYQAEHAFGLFLLDPAKQALSLLPPENFIVQASSTASYPYSPAIYAYRDNRFSLLFWKQATEPDYRMVPFSTGGLKLLTSNVTKGRLLEAVRLPLPGGLLSLTSIPEYGFDQDSVTEIKIAFGKVPTSIYNWEVFFHNPLLVATQLSQAQRFEEAQRWFHLIFDPTTNEPGPESVRYWRFSEVAAALGHVRVGTLSGHDTDGDALRILTQPGH